MIRRRIAPSVLLLALACVLCIPCCGKSADPEAEKWLTIKSGDVVLQYQPGMEDDALAMLPELVKIYKDPAALNRAAMSAQLRELRAKREDILKFVASRIGLDKPGPVMTRTYDEVLQRFLAHAGVLRDFKRFRLWDRDRLKAPALAGMVPCAAYNAADDWFDITLDAGMRVIIHHGSSKGGMSRSPSVGFLPICHRKGGSWRQSLARFQRSVAEAAGSALVPQTVFHEAVELGIVGDLGLKSAFRRWFCEGAADCVGELCIKQFFGQRVYDKAVKSSDIARHARLRSQVNLIGWRAMEYDATQPKNDLTDAYYDYATYEVRGLIERHGPDTVARVMKELGKSNTRDSRAILDAIEVATGEDIEPGLREYGSEAKDDFPGLAIGQLEFVAFTPDGKGGVDSRMLEPGKEIAVDGKQGSLGVQFIYGVENLPVKLRLDAVGPGATYRTLNQLEGQGDKQPRLASGFPSSSVLQFKPGSYKLQLYFNDKLFKEIPVKLVKP